MEKNSFILYIDQKEVIEQLSDEEAGKLFKAIYQYNYNKDIIIDGMLKIIFTQFKIFFDKDNEKWELEKNRRSEAGKKGMASRWNKSDNNVINSYNKDNSVINVITNDNKEYQSITNITDNVNVNDNDNVNVNNNIKENIKRKNFIKPTIEEIQNYCEVRNNGINAEAFYDFYESKNWYVGKNKMKDWEACIRTWEKRQNPNQVKMKVSTPQPEWLDMPILEEKATEEEIKQLEERLNRK